MALEILFGGRIRPSFDVPTTYDSSTTWEQGDILTLDSDGFLKKADNSTVGFVGLALEYRREVVGTNYSVDQTSTGKGSVLADTALIKTDALSSGVTPGIGDKLYIDANGKFTNVPGAMVVGVCVGKPDSSNKVVILWSPEYSGT